LIIEEEHYAHYIKYKSDYYSMCNYNQCNTNFKNILISALHNNIHVNEIRVVTRSFYYGGEDKLENIKKIIKLRNWKSIYMAGESYCVIEALISQQYPNLIKVELSQLFPNCSKFIRNTPSLKHFEFRIYSDDQSIDYIELMQTIHESHIQTLIIDDDSYSSKRNFEFIDSLFESKIKNLHFKSSYCNQHVFNLTNNYTILNFTENGTLPIYAEKILDRNRNYAFTVLLCMNRKIIPRCVFKNLVLKHLFSL